MKTKLWWIFGRGKIFRNLMVEKQVVEMGLE